MTDDELAYAAAERMKNILYLCGKHKAIPLFCILTTKDGETVVWVPSGSPPAQIVNLIQNDFLPRYKEASGL